MTTAHGFAFVFFGGASVGFCMWPLKWARSWKFENFWLVFCLVSLVIVPGALAWWVLPHLSTFYGSLSARELSKPLLFGVLWGFSQLGVGICLHELGLAVSGSILNGIGSAVGTLAPIILLHRAMLFQTKGLLILLGTTIMLVGVTLCGWSGYHREQEAKRQGRGTGFAPEQSAMTQKAHSRWGYLLYVGVALASGVFSALTNIALAYSADIMAKVPAAGGTTAWASFAVWPLVLMGGSVVNIAYSVYLLSRNHTWGNFAYGFREGFNPVLAGCLWMGGNALFSSGAGLLGVLGLSVGFAIFTIITIGCRQVAAVFTGEWHRMQANIYRSFAGGLACLFLAVLTIGASNYLGK